MMFTPVYTKQFEKDVHRSQRRGKNLEKFKIIARTLIAGHPLDAIHRDHRLVGNCAGRRECHIESNWVLIYKIEGSRIIFERMGTHSDLFTGNLITGLIEMKHRGKLKMVEAEVKKFRRFPKSLAHMRSGRPQIQP